MAVGEAAASHASIVIVSWHGGVSWAKREEGSEGWISYAPAMCWIQSPLSQASAPGTDTRKIAEVDPRRLIGKCAVYLE